MVTRRRPSPPGETAEASYGGPAPRLPGEQRSRHHPEDNRQRQLDAVRGCERTALARTGLPPLSTPHPFAGPAAPPSPPVLPAHGPAAPSGAPPTLHPAVPWDELVGSAKESVRQTWFPMVGRMIGLDDSMMRTLSATDGTGPQPPSPRGAKTPPAVRSRDDRPRQQPAAAPPTARTPLPARHDW
ncbi:hypothetical protein ACWCQW_48175 [Streptomyces mirabilis]